MKKIFFLIATIIAATVGVTGCGDNDEFSSPHELTAEEIHLIRMRDSIDSVNRTKIDADLVLSYTVKDYVTESGMWTFKSLYVDIDQVAEVFGLTETEVYAKILSGDITGCAMNAQTHAFSETSTTTNGVIGHWWRSDSIIGTWANDFNYLVCYAEWEGWYDDENDSYEDNYYNIGQMPGVLEPGYSINIYEGMKYQDKRVIFKITFAMIDPNNSSIVGSEDISVNIPKPTKGYPVTDVAIDFAKICKAIELTDTLDQSTNLIAPVADGYTQVLTGKNGFKYDADGYVTDDSKATVLSVAYPGSDEDENTIGITPYRSNIEVGDSYLVKFGFFYDNNIYFLNLKVNITESE